ncbi:unnamed protein product [Rhizoctonia solani]|uniref:Uncharacterized protein n=1 Tax=Rhizoctonia solani TaxID=456999 RepID=A0A8H3BB04_9AGAM|nr:unnamed protein product [Rhizoctonia solani]
MKSPLNALAYALLESTNPLQLERPGYTYWNHVFVSYSNAKNNFLWTSPDHPVVVHIGEHTVYDCSWYDEEDDDDEEDEYAESNEKEVDSRILDSDYNPDDSRSIRSSFFGEALALPQSSTQNLHVAQEDSSPPQSVKYPLRPRSLYPIHNYTGHNLQAGVNSPCSGRRRTRRERIVDFAVKYLAPDGASEEIKLLDFTLPSLKPVKVPIVAEGKRAPGRANTNNSEAIEDHLKVLLQLAYRDFIIKRQFIFKAYSCKSFIAIAFAGPYWSFAVCQSDLSPLIWSKPISAASKVHGTVLKRLFQAAETSPDDPGAVDGIDKLVRQYQRKEIFEVLL